MTSHIQCDLPLIVAAVSTIAIGTSTGVAIAVCPATVASSTIASSIASAGSAGVAVAIAMAEGARRSIGAICVGSKLLRKLFLLGNGILNSLLLGRDVVLVLLLLSRDELLVLLLLSLHELLALGLGLVEGLLLSLTHLLDLLGGSCRGGRSRERRHHGRGGETYYWLLIDPH